MDKNLSLLLSNVKGIGNAKIRKFYAFLGFGGMNSKALYDNTNVLYEAIQNSKIKPTITVAELEIAKAITEKILSDCTKYKINVVGMEDSLYPASLKELNKAPFVLFYKGNIESLNKYSAVAVVGTRNPTDMGKKVAKRFGNILAEQGFMVVSGLALGCDTLAHTGCLEGKGITVAVLAGGLDSISPKENCELANEILNNNGCLISEYPPLAQPTKYTFVQRDYIQSALSKAIIVVEAGLKSGTMQTVNFAKEQNRIIGVFEHSDSKYLSLEQTEGNREIIESGLGHALKDRTSLDSFINILKR